jgi:hypothetical protein
LQSKCSENSRISPLPFTPECRVEDLDPRRWVYVCGHPMGTRSARCRRQAVIHCRELVPPGGRKPIPRSKKVTAPVVRVNAVLLLRWRGVGGWHAGVDGKSFDPFRGFGRAHSAASVSAWAVMKCSYSAPCKEKSAKMLRKKGPPRSTRHIT